MKEVRRIVQRRRIFKTGQIVFGSSAIDCIVRDLSATGARVAVQSPLWFPDSFTLVITSDGSSRKAHVAWKKGGQIGIAFDD
jgi:hypothetical protein